MVRCLGDFAHAVMPRDRPACAKSRRQLCARRGFGPRFCAPYGSRGARRIFRRNRARGPRPIYSHPRRAGAGPAILANRGQGRSPRGHPDKQIEDLPSRSAVRDGSRRLARNCRCAADERPLALHPGQENGHHERVGIRYLDAAPRRARRGSGPRCRRRAGKSSGGHRQSRHSRFVE